MKKREPKNLVSLEHVLEKELPVLINDAIGQQPTDVSCKFIGKSDIAILIENVRTPLEIFLSHYCQPEIVQDYRTGLEYAIGIRVKKLVEKTVGKPIDKFSISRQTETRWMGIFALLQ